MCSPEIVFNFLASFFSSLHWTLFLHLCMRAPAFAKNPCLPLPSPSSGWPCPVWYNYSVMPQMLRAIVSTSNKSEHVHYIHWIFFMMAPPVACIWRIRRKKAHVHHPHFQMVPFDFELSLSIGISTECSRRAFRNEIEHKTQQIPSRGEKILFV